MILLTLVIIILPNGIALLPKGIIILPNKIAHLLKEIHIITLEIAGIKNYCPGGIFILEIPLLTQGHKETALRRLGISALQSDTNHT